MSLQFTQSQVYTIHRPTLVKYCIALVLWCNACSLCSQSKISYRYIHGDLYLQSNLSTELGLVYNHLHDEQKNDAHQLWARYLDKPHPAVSTIEKYFLEASVEFGVPVELLKAIGQVENNFTQIGPSIDKGWGIMHLVQNNYCNTLSEAAHILRVSDEILKDDARENIRGAAALLKKYNEEKTEHKQGIEDWYEATKKISGLINEELRTIQANRYYSIVKDGVHSVTLWGEEITLPKHNYLSISFLNGTDGSRSADYSPAVSSFTNCNYSISRNHSIDTYVNHWIGTGTAAGAVSWFQNCNAQASAHFVVNNAGTIYQVVPVANTAWHCGASGYPYNNGRSIGVEHEATIANPGLWNSTAMLQASAQMSCYFCNLYNIPTNQNITSPGICGHNSMPGTNTNCPGSIPWNTWFSYFNTGNCSAPAPAQPDNDYCGNATSLTVYGNSCGIVTTGDVSGATQSTAPTLCDGYTSNNANDVWYTFVATSSAHNITVIPSGGLDAVIELRSGCPGTSIDCADNGGGEGSTEVLMATGLTAGNTYHVRIYDYSGSSTPPTTTAFTICVTTPCTNPVKPVISGIDTICSGQLVTLTVTNPCSGCNFMWSNGTSGTQIIAATTNTFTVTASNACGSISSHPFILTVNQTPQPVISDLSNAYCLASSNATLSATPSGGVFSGNGISGNVFSPVIAGEGTHIITYTITKNGCTGIVQQNTTVSTNPLVQISSNDSTTFCQGNSIILTATQGSSYVWSTGDTTQSIAVNYAAAFNVTVTNPGGCNASVSAQTPVTTSFFPNPVANAGSDTTITTGDTILLGGNPTATNGNYPYSYVWAPSTSLSSATDANPSASPSVVTLYSVSVTDANECTASDNVLVNISTPCTYIIPQTNLYFSSAAAVDSFYVDAENNCAPWNLLTCNWIQILSPALPHTGDAMVIFSVTENTDTAASSCTIDLTGGDYVNIFQEGVVDDPCSPPLVSPIVQQNFCNLATPLLQGVSYQWFLNGQLISNATTRFCYVNQSGYYSVQIADANFCTAVSTDTYIAYPACLGTSAETESRADFSFRVVSNKWVEVTVSENALGYNCLLYNTVGQLVWQEKISSTRFSISMETMPTGIYFCVIKNETGSLTARKIIH